MAKQKKQFRELSDEELKLVTGGGKISLDIGIVNPLVIQTITDCPKCFEGYHLEDCKCVRDQELEQVNGGTRLASGGGCAVKLCNPGKEMDPLTCECI